MILQLFKDGFGLRRQVFHLVFVIFWVLFTSLSPCPHYFPNSLELLRHSWITSHILLTLLTRCHNIEAHHLTKLLRAFDCFENSGANHRVFSAKWDMLMLVHKRVDVCVFARIKPLVTEWLAYSFPWNVASANVGITLRTEYSWCKSKAFVW